MIFILVSAILGSLIGWVTNKVAIKMLFKPVMPVKIGFLTIQGVFPKRQGAIAKSLGKIVETDLVGLDDLKSAIATKENIDLIKTKIKDKLEKIIEENVPPMLLAMAGEQINVIIEKFTSDDGEFINELIESITNSSNGVDISKIVESKVNSMDFSKFESVLLELIEQELKHIEFIGAVLGLLIGVTQGVILTILKEM